MLAWKEGFYFFTAFANGFKLRKQMQNFKNDKGKKMVNKHDLCFLMWGRKGECDLDATVCIPNFYFIFWIRCVNHQMCGHFPWDISEINPDCVKLYICLDRWIVDCQKIYSKKKKKTCYLSHSLLSNLAWKEQKWYSWISCVDNDRHVKLHWKGCGFVCSS